MAIFLTCDSCGQHHGEECDEQVGVLPQSHVGLAAGLLEPTQRENIGVLLE